MNRSMIMVVLCLSACAPRVPDLEIPRALTTPVLVECARGSTLGALGSCAIQLRRALNEANGQLEQIQRILETRSQRRPG